MYLLEMAAIQNVLPFVAMFLVIYLFMIRPQIKKQKNEKKFQEDLSRGTKVITTGGMHGKVVELNEKDNTIVIETSAGKIKFDRSAVSMELTSKLNGEAKKK